MAKAEKISSISAAFKQVNKIPEHLKLAMQFEKRILTTCIDKIAMLDADVRVRGRRGATFPSQLGYGTNWDGTDKHQSWIQSQEDYSQ